MNTLKANTDRHRDDIDTQFDQAFESISALKWLPWVGMNYADLPSAERLWIVGESHYAWENVSKAETKEISKRFLSGKEFTRYVAWDWGVGKRNTKARLPRAIERALFGRPVNEADTDFIWQSVVYSNRVQRALESIKHRPDEKNHQDYSVAWETFFPLLKILKPRYCLFAGVEISGYQTAFLKAAEANGFRIEKPIISLSKIGNVKPRVAEVVSNDGQCTKLLFIKHPGQPFPWRKWSTLLWQEMGDYTTWLSSKRQ